MINWLKWTIIDFYFLKKGVLWFTFAIPWGWRYKRGQLSTHTLYIHRIFMMEVKTIFTMVMGVKNMLVIIFLLQFPFAIFYNFVISIWNFDGAPSTVNFWFLTDNFNGQI